MHGRYTTRYAIGLLIYISAMPAALSDPISSRQQIAGPEELSAYASEFAQCDRREVFNGRPVDQRVLCDDDPNQLQAFEMLPGGVLRFVSKLSLDLDGGWKACNDPGETDLCPTTYVYDAWRMRAAEDQLENWQSAFVSSDRVPYIVIPYSWIAGGKAKRDSQFSELTGIGIGDVGVVTHAGIVVPVLVADGGPSNKIGEGSIALFEALEQSRCVEWHDRLMSQCAQVENMSLEGLVETILFPNSQIFDLTPQNTNESVRVQAMRLYDEFLAGQTAGQTTQD